MSAERMRGLGYTFETLSSFTEMQGRWCNEYLQRLKLMGEWADSEMPTYCQCSAMVWDSDREGFMVPYLYCVIIDGKDAIGCPYVKASKEHNEIALQLRMKYILDKEG